MFKFFSHNKVQKIACYLTKANDFYLQKQYIKAIKYYQKILRLDSSHYAANANIACSYFELENYEQACIFFRHLIKLEYSNPWWHNYLSQSCQKQQLWEESLNEAIIAVDLSNGDNSHQLNLGYSIYEMSDFFASEKIQNILQQWYQKYPQNPIVKQVYKSFFYDKNFVRCEPDYVENLFDVFAESFDDTLSDLEYNTPKLIADFLAEYYPDKKTEFSVLDLGCGSGLCAQKIKNIFSFSQITGVDISQQMLLQAKQKNIYKNLYKSDITSCNNIIKSRFDIIVSADVFTYFGDLSTVIKLSSDLLSKQGVFIFSVSKNDLNSSDFFLTSSSRFVHSKKYVQSLLIKHNFSIKKTLETRLRFEGEKEVIGYIFLCVLN